MLNRIFARAFSIKTSRRLLLANVDASIKQPDIEKALPKATNTKVLVRMLNQNVPSNQAHKDWPCAFLDFPNENEAAEAFAKLNGSIKVGRHTLPVSYVDMRMAEDHEIKVHSIRQGLIGGQAGFGGSSLGTSEQRMASLIGG